MELYSLHEPSSNLVEEMLPARSRSTIVESRLGPRKFSVCTVVRYFIPPIFNFTISPILVGARRHEFGYSWEKWVSEPCRPDVGNQADGVPHGGLVGYFYTEEQAFERCLFEYKLLVVLTPGGAVGP